MRRRDPTPPRLRSPSLAPRAGRLRSTISEAGDIRHTNFSAISDPIYRHRTVRGRLAIGARLTTQSQVRGVCVRQFIVASGLVASLALFAADAASAAECDGTSATYKSVTGSSYDITFRFDRTYTCGKYVNGDVWVLDPGSGVRLTGITPNASGGRNGWIVNPNASNTDGFGKQAFDQRASGYEAGLLPSLPLTVSAPGSVIKVASDNPGGDCSGGNDTGAVDNKDDRSCVRQMAVLTIVATAPGAQALRPPAIASAARRGTTFSYANARESLLPAVAAVGSTISKAEAESRVRQARLLPIETEIPADRLRPEEAVPHWGTEVASADADVLLWLASNAATIAEKRPTIIGMIQVGIDNWGALESGMKFDHGGGGNQNSHYAPVLFAAIMLWSSEIRSTLASNNRFYEFKMVPRGHNGVPLFGRMTTNISAKCQWDRWIAGTNDGTVGSCPLNRDVADPYGYIDGPSVPGTSYANATAGAARGLGLAGLLIPELWEEAERAAAGAAIFEFGRRSWEVGTWMEPDQCKAWPTGCSSTSCGGYGSTWGDNGSGGCIKGTPSRASKMSRKHGDAIGTDRHSTFAKDMIARHGVCAASCSAACPGMTREPVGCQAGARLAPPSWR